MPEPLEIEFHEAMHDIYRRGKSEEKYNAQRFLQMVIDYGGIHAARMLIDSDTVSDGYAALWEKDRLDLTVEAMIVESPKFHPLFTDDELAICSSRLTECGYKP